ncbi:sca1 complex scaffold protein scaa [Anaeramoeba flamelloides]|uniref:Sca1 complex scaffold protein scaa n=1 Tax=Anaeramoeba flamelloides TaxID=1746091 RepID=A0AAV7Z0C9_9EUKA|nr:sca1 complex scaffold protein scaa [Anaeramoeba flamelloides]
MSSNFLQFSQEYQGLSNSLSFFSENFTELFLLYLFFTLAPIGSKYNGPYIDTTTTVEATELEKTYGQSAPVYIDSKGNLYNLYYLPIEQKQCEGVKKKIEETKAKQTNCVLGDPYFETREGKMEQTKQLSSSDLSHFDFFPDPDDFETYEEYEEAALNWKNEILNKIGTLQLPETISVQTYQFPDYHLKQKKEIESIDETNEKENIINVQTDRETFGEENNENKEDQEDNEDKGSDLDERAKKDLCVDRQEDNNTPFTDQDQSKIFKLLEKDINSQEFQENTKLKDYSMNLKLLLNSNDPWESSLIPKEPRPEYYKTYSEFERSYRRWSQIVSNQLKVIPMHARQLQQQALLKPNKKKLKKKKKILEDYSRDYVTWSKTISPKLLKHSPNYSFPIFNKLNSISNKQKLKNHTKCIHVKKNRLQMLPELTQECKENISKLFDGLLSKTRFNQRIYSSNNTQIVGKFTPILQKKGKKAKKNKLSNIARLRGDLAKEIIKSRYQKPFGTGSTLIDFIIPAYDLSSPISWELVINKKKHSIYRDEIENLQNEFRLKKYSNKFLVSKYTPFQDSTILLPVASKENLKKFSNFVSTICQSKFNHTKIAANILLNKLKGCQIASKFITEYAKEKDTISNYLFSHPTMISGDNMKEQNSAIYFNLDKQILTQMEQYLNRRKEIFDQYEEDEKERERKQSNTNQERISYENGLITYNNILNNPSSITAILSKYFKDIYGLLSKPNNNLDIKDSILLNEGFYNEIISKLKKNLNTHLPTINVIGKILKEMVHCLFKLRLIVGTYRSSSNLSSPKFMKKKGLMSFSNYNNMMGNRIKSPRTGSKSKYSSMTIKGLTRSGTFGAFHSSSNDVLALANNQNKINPQKRLVFKENRILQIIDLIQNFPKEGSIRRNLLCALSYLMRERTIYLTIYSSSSFFQNLRQFCLENTDLKFSKVAWKLFYQVILYHSETCAYLIKTNIFKSFIEIIIVSSGNNLIYPLHYMNKIFRMAEIEEKRSLVPNSNFKRYYESNPMQSYTKDSKLITNWFTSTLQYTRFCRIHRSLKNNYSANYIKLTSIFYTFIKNKNCSKIRNELKNSQEYSDVFNWYLSIFKNNNLLNDKYSLKRNQRRKKKKRIKKKKMYEKFTIMRKNSTGSLKKKNQK